MVKVGGKIVKLSQNRGLEAIKTQGSKKGKVNVKIKAKKCKKDIDNASKRW